MAGYAKQARGIADALLREPLPRRWAHTVGVAGQAGTLEPILGAEDADLIEAAAWLHDVGYSPALVSTGFHPLDGARHVRALDSMPGTISTLVANHTYAWFEARKRALEADLVSEFPVDDDRTSWLIDVLTYCDMTTGPTGRRVAINERIGEILARYEPDDVVHQAIQEAAPLIRERGARVGRQLGRATVSADGG